MTIEHSVDDKPVEERIKQRIAKWTGLPKPEELTDENIISPGNMIATRPLFEKDARIIYSRVDRVIGFAKRVGIIK